MLKAPFPWFGGKSRVASLVWDRFGNPINYVEPFFGSGAVLLGRPHEPKNETVNDKDAYLANFWLSLKLDPEQVAFYADDPVNETFLHSRHKWLVDLGRTLQQRMDENPDFYDAKIAGWWVWGISQWIGSGWCTRPEWKGRTNAGRVVRGIHAAHAEQIEPAERLARKRPQLPRGDHGVLTKRPLLGKGGVGTNRQSPPGEPWHKRPKIENGGSGIHNPPRQLPDVPGAGGRGVFAKYVSGATPEQIPYLSDSGVGIFSAQSHALYDYLEALSSRFRRVRVCCGEWDRILGPSPTTKIGLTGVFLDPPYSVTERADVYNEESRWISEDVRKWAIKHGDDPLLRIAVCGYDGEHSFPDSWECVSWKANGGYGNQSGKTRGKENAHRERIWFSPACLKPGLFSNLDLDGESV